MDLKVLILNINTNTLTHTHTHTHTHAHIYIIVYKYIYINIYVKKKAVLKAELCFYRYVHFACVPVYIFGLHHKQCASD